MLWLSLALAAPTDPPAVTWRVADHDLAPTARPGGGAVRGRIEAGHSFAVLEHPVAGPDGCAAGWAAVEARGFVCLDGTAPTAEAPASQPPLVVFDHPQPFEYDTYRDTGAYDRQPVEELDPSEGLVPFVYGKRWRRWKGPVYASLAAWEAGEPPASSLLSARKFAFVEAVPTARGEVLVRDDGSVVPVDEVFLYAIDRFRGLEVAVDPVPEGLTPGWAVGWDGAALYAAPGDATPALQVEHHTLLWVDPTPMGPGARWLRVPDGLGPGVDGYARSGVARWVPAPPPAGVGPDQLWLDADLSQQVIALRRGEALEVVTLLSSGLGRRWATPPGLYRVLDKAVYGDMASRAGAEEPYYVEHVPWVMHFRPRYALHGVFWHWGFGQEASHGCVNLAPRDAHALFDRVSPTLPDGWHSVVERADDPGTLLRVRIGLAEPPDRRPPLPVEPDTLGASP